MLGPVLLALIALLAAAKLGGVVADRLGQPAVLGELLAGVLVGALPLLGVHALDYLRTDEVVHALADLGAILLLFEIGLETRLADLVAVGVSSALVAVAGVGTPLALGYLVGAWLWPAGGVYGALFLGATLCATSVGITARVLRDLGQLATPVGRIVLGAAVIDDVLGLIVLAVMSGLAGGKGGMGGTIALASVKAVGFVAGALVLGRLIAPRLFGLVALLRDHTVLFALALIACFGLAWLSAEAGLAPIVGAFAAGLVLEGVPFGRLSPGGEDLTRLIHPLSALLVPIFFVRMGLEVRLEALSGGSLWLAGALTVAAILGKQACGLAVVTRGADRLAVGLAMIPRGEVGLIFAGVGLSLMVNGAPILGGSEFAAVVCMVLVTTVITPPLLRWRLARPAKRLPA